MRRHARNLAGLALLLTLAATAATAAQSSTVTMRGLFEALVTLLPHSLDAAGFEREADREAITAGLVALAHNAGILERHGLGLNPSYQRAGATLAQDAREALSSFRTGATHTARFIVRNMTENCFACHSRLPAGERPEIGERLAAGVDLERVPIGDRLRLLVATRQFEAAMQLAEAAMADATIDAATIDLAGIFEAYLKVAVRVARDLDRPRAALWSFVQRDDLPVYLNLQVSEWVDSIEAIRGMTIRDELVQARELLEESRRLNLYMQDRRGLVQATVASALLHQFVQAAPESTVDLAEAYYLLGVAESAISRSIWTPETEYFLESAIRSAPQTAAARDAYAFLEQFVIASYTGSSGTDVPDHAWERLMELRDLVTPAER